MSTAVLMPPARFASNSGKTLSDNGVRRLLAKYRGKSSAVVVEDFKMRPGMIYTQVRAISARINQNFDAWPSEELKLAYRTFIGKPIFVNHHNEDPGLARGRVVAARYIENAHDKYIEVVQETDGKRFPILGHELRTGGMDSVSMGVEAGFTICSICENRASDVHNMCDHILFHKGEYLPHAKTGAKTLVYENCHKLGFFELSYVFDPADETAVISRVIAAGRHTATAHQWADGVYTSQAQTPDGQKLTVRYPWGEDNGDGSHSGNPHYEWQHHTGEGRPVSGIAPSLDEGKAAAEQSHHDLSGGWDPDVNQEAQDPRLLGASKWYHTPVKQASWYRQAWGEVEAPEDIDTLRDEDEDDNDDDFHHYVDSPKELQEPDMDATKRLDREQETDGLDDGRRAEDAEEYGAPGEQDPESDEEDSNPPMPINLPATKKGRRTRNQGVRMSRYHYADDESDDGSGDGGAGDVAALVDEAEQDLQQYQDQDGGDFGDDGGDDGSDEGDDGSDQFGGDEGGDQDGGDFGDEGDDDGGYDDDSDDGGDYGSDESDDQGGDPEESGDGGGDVPPWLQGKEARRTRSVNQSGSGVNRRQTTGGTAMSGSNLAQRSRVASTRRHHQADNSGYTDGGPYGVDDSQGAQEDVFISQVPGAEAVEAPTPGDGQISNSENNLVARRRQAWQEPTFDPNHYQRLADVVAALPKAQRRAVAEKMVREFKADNAKFNELTFYKAAKVALVRKGNRVFFAEELKAPDKVDPALSGTDVSDLKGSDFESLALDNVETQPKDASIHAFQTFDRWLLQATGKTAAQHGNSNYIRRAAASYAKASRNPQAALQGLFPTLDFVLREARTREGGADMRHRAADESLDVAAPQGRIDVEAPVKNVTDAEAQASQFDLGDFADNAGDNLADPVLDAVDGNAGTWAPDQGKESSVKLASGVEAVRCADAHIAAMPTKYSEDDRWTLTAQFENLRQSTVRDRTRLLETVIEANKNAPRKVTAATSRGTKGIPQGFANGRGVRRTAGSQRTAATDPDTDSLMFF